MSTETKAVLFNAVPLLLLAALYLAVGVALAPTFWRERGRMRDLAYGSALLFPCVGFAAAIVGAQLLIDREPLGGHLWLSLPAILVAGVPIVALLASWGDRELLITGALRARAADELTTLRDRELQAVERLSRGLARAHEPGEIGRLVADEAIELFAVDLAELALVDDAGRVARIVAAREGGRDVDWLVGLELDLEREPAGMATVLSQAAPFAVLDAASSPLISSRLTKRARAKSVAYVPVFADDRTVGALVVATRAPRAFEGEELSLMQAFASEAGIALARAASAVALAEALERERLVARISREVRSRFDLDELLNVTCAESARAVGCNRVFIGIAEPGQPLHGIAQWAAEGVQPVAADSDLPVSTLAARERRTVAAGDVREAAELRDSSLGDVAAVVARGTLAVLATPMVAMDEVIGTLSFERPQPTVWSPSEILLAEAVAREAASAVHTGRVLHESSRRLAEQTALLSAGQALTSQLRFDAVISRIVEEMRTLLSADAVDCWTLRPGGRELECRAVLGLPESVVGRRAPIEGSLAESDEHGAPVLRRNLGQGSAPIGGERGFAEAMEAQLRSFGEVRGVLAAYAREPGTFSDDDLRLIAAFAGLASIALRNAEAFEESTRRTQVERGFYRIASVLGETLSAEATLDAVAQTAVEALGGVCGAVLRPFGNELELAGAYELPEPLAAFFLGEGARDLRPAADGARILASSSLEQETRFGAGLPAVAAGAGLPSLLAVPLAQPRTDANGLVLVFFSGEHRLTDEQLELAGHVAGAARGALERSDLYELERRSRGLAQRLATAARALSSELDPEDVLGRAAEHAAALLDAAAAAVWVLEGDELVLHAAVGEGTTSVVETRVASTAWLLGDIVQSRRPTVLVDVAEDDRAAEIDPLLAAGYVTYLAVPVLGPNGSVQGVLSVYGRVVREWREEESEALLALASAAAAARANALQYQEVRHQQQRSEAILANVADGIVAVDREGRVVLWNRAAEEITRVPAAEALGRAPAELLGRPLSGNGELRSTASRLVSIRRGSDEAWLSVSEAVMTDPAGAVAGRIYAFRDISSERAVEQMKSDFVSTVSHELRTPLTSIFGFAETLLRRDVLFGEAERETFLRYISSESERLTAIVDRLLSVAQLDTGAMAVQIGTTEVGAVVADVLDAAERKLGGNGHRFELALEEGPLAAQADADKLKQVLNHLLDNAVRYSPGGARVTVGARRSDGTVEVRVEDEGIGIPRAEQERIFRKFYRGEGTARTAGTGATGLGLFLAAGLVEAMGGRIWLDSDEGRGATFVVELPVARA